MPTGLTLSDWKGPAFKKLLSANLDKKMTVVGILLTNELKQITTELDNKDGDEPSEPGEPPAKVSGRLSASMTYLYESAKKLLQVGTPVLYGKFLELGTKFMSPRPYLRPTFRKNKKKIEQIIRGK